MLFARLVKSGLFQSLQKGGNYNSLEDVFVCLNERANYYFEVFSGLFILLNSLS